MKVQTALEWSFGSLSMMSNSSPFSLHQGRILSSNTWSMIGPSIFSCSKCRFRTSSLSAFRDRRLFTTCWEWKCIISFGKIGDRKCVSYPGRVTNSTKIHKMRRVLVDSKHLPRLVLVSEAIIKSIFRAARIQPPRLMVKKPEFLLPLFPWCWERNNPESPPV